MENSKCTECKGEGGWQYETPEGAGAEMCPHCEGTGTEPLKNEIMLGEKIEQKLKELRDLATFGCDNETILISFTLNSEGWDINIVRRSADSLKMEGISMRNIKGEFIKPKQ